MKTAPEKPKVRRSSPTRAELLKKLSRCTLSELRTFVAESKLPKLRIGEKPDHLRSWNDFEFADKRSRENARLAFGGVGPAQFLIVGPTCSGKSTFVRSALRFRNWKVSPEAFPPSWRDGIPVVEMRRIVSRKAVWFDDVRCDRKAKTLHQLFLLSLPSTFQIRIGTRNLVIPNRLIVFVTSRDLKITDSFHQKVIRLRGIKAGVLK